MEPCPWEDNAGREASVLRTSPSRGARQRLEQDGVVAEGLAGGPHTALHFSGTAEGRAQPEVVLPGDERRREAPEHLGHPGIGQGQIPRLEPEGGQLVAGYLDGHLDLVGEVAGPAIGGVATREGSLEGRPPHESQGLGQVLGLIAGMSEQPLKSVPVRGDGVGEGVVVAGADEGPRGQALAQRHEVVAERGRRRLVASFDPDRCCAARSSVNRRPGWSARNTSTSCSGLPLKGWSETVDLDRPENLHHDGAGRRSLPLARWPCVRSSAAGTRGRVDDDPALAVGLAVGPPAPDGDEENEHDEAAAGPGPHRLGRRESLRRPVSLRGCRSVLWGRCRGDGRLGGRRRRDGRSGGGTTSGSVAGWKVIDV